MAGKKKKKKDKKNLSGSLSHIASQLVPSAIFAAVPRSASTPLSSTWPRTTASSPVAQAVGEAGNVGFAFVGNIQRSSSQGELEGNQGEGTGRLEVRPRALLPSTSAQQQPDDEDPAYEAVEVSGRRDSYDKTTKFYHTRNEAKTEDESQKLEMNGDENYYDDVVEDWQGNPVVEPVYAKVDKTKKKKSVLSQSQASDQQKNDDDEGSGIDISSSDEDLTDVTANDDNSSVSSKTRPSEVNTNIGIQKEQNQSSRLQKTRRRNKDDETSEESSSRNVDSLKAKHETLIGKAQEEQGMKRRKSRDKNLRKTESQPNKSHPSNVPHEVSTQDEHSEETIEKRTSVELESSLVNKKRSSRKSSAKKKTQAASEEARCDDDNTTIHTVKPAAVNENEKPDKESRQSERLGFEGVSQNVGLSDISEDEESYLLRLSQSKFEHQRTEFEKENFHETPVDSFDTDLVEEPHAMESNDFSLTEASPASLQWSTGSLHNGYDVKRYGRSPESPYRHGDARETSEKIFIQQQKHLEDLIRQQENVYKQQAEQQKQQQKQTDKLVQQQQELQGQLRLLEQIQYDRVQGMSSAVSDHDVRIQKEMVEQQGQFLRSQQKQQLHYEHHQERILQQQENLCSQIRQLELQMRDVQSNISSLTPKEKDLSEIRWQEQEIIRLLNEQKHHQEQYEQLHRQQLQQMQDKELKFQQERQSLQVQQDFLKSKMIEQEEKSKKLEKELHNVSSKEKRHHTPDSEGSQVLHAESYHDEVDAAPVARKEAKRSSKTSKQIHEVLSDNSRLLEVNASLQQENAVLKHYSEALHKGTTGGSSLIMQQQIKELQEENKVLRETVHRVNVELSRYQTKYRQATAEDFPVLLSKIKTKEPSPWLVNTKFLAPLFLAYDDRLKEREDIIKTYDEELTAFKARLMEIVKENQDLHMRLTQFKPDALDLDEWQQLQEEAKLVVEENAILMKQQEQQQRKLKELQRSHGQDVSKLSMRIATLESEKKSLETELENSRHNCANLSQKYKEMVDEEETKINVEAHLSMIDECRSVVEDLNLKKNSEIEDLESRLNVTHEEKQNLASSLTDSNAQISQLTKELDVNKKTQRKLERKTLFLERKLEHILEREVTAQQTLSEVLKVAEKTAEERDSFEEFAKSQELKQKKSKSLIHQGDLNILGLQEKLKQNKKKLNHKVASLTGRLNEKEKEVKKMKEEYEQEINRLRELVREKQNRIETIMGERRIFDQQLDMVWKKADQDNQQMINSVKENQSTQEQ